MRRLHYAQSSGTLSLCNGDFACPFAAGYAGRAIGRDNPDMDHVKNIGPLPRGVYSMRVVEHPRFAAPAIQLVQTDGEGHGRSGFFIHGDNAKADYSASSGCIVLDKPTRLVVAALIRLGFDKLEVGR